ncbi:MAG: LD-carboxypeptidase [Cyclobacteriaceae bacterium]|nr:LD-carboxypeptidase [Cyclobacteriaceae bacterium]
MQPPFVKPGMTAGVVVPSRKVDDKLFKAGCEVIASWGLKIKLGKYCFSETSEYLAAPDENRTEDLQSMLNDPKVDIIFCGRGGYGMTRILDRLDFTQFLKKPKHIVGFSDITALHLHLHTLGVQSIHGPMPTQYSRAEYGDSISCLRKLLFGEIQPLHAEYFTLNRIGEASGKIIGGNLSLLADSLGTSSEPDTEGKILVIEEVDEYLYKVDRMIVQLKRAGKFSKLAGLIIGHMTDMKDTDFKFSNSVEELIINNVREFDFPVAFQFPVGHEAPNYPWVHGADAHLLVAPDRSILNY